RASVGRAPNVALIRVNIPKAQEIETALRIRGQHRVAAELVGGAPDRPGGPAIGRKGIARLPEIAVRADKLPPTDSHAIRIGRVNAERRLVGGITHNVLAERSDVYLKAGA